MRLIKRTVAFFIDYTLFVIPASIILLSLEFSGALNIHIALVIFSLTYSLVLCRDIVGGQSIGKKLLKLKVVSNSNRKEPPIWEHIIRSIFIPLWIPELIMLGINSSKRLGDYVANTSVKECSKKWKNKAKIEVKHYFIIFSVAAILYIIFLLLFLNTKVFRLYYNI